MERRYVQGIKIVTIGLKTDKTDSIIIPPSFPEAETRVPSIECEVDGASKVSRLAVTII